MGNTYKTQYNPIMPGRSPYVTFEEMQKNPKLIDDNDFGDGDPRYTYGTVPEIFLKHVPDRSAKILDCGALYGRFVEFLQKHGYKDVQAMDFVNVMSHGDPKNYTFHTLNMNTERFPYEDGSLDAVTAWGAPEHLENPFHFIREVHRVLKDGGTYIMSVPNMEHLVTRLVFLKNAEMRQWEEHNNHITLYPTGVFKKGHLRYFDLIEKDFLPGAISLRPKWIFGTLTKLLGPTHPWVGHHVVYVLRKKPFVPYA